MKTLVFGLLLGRALVSAACSEIYWNILPDWNGNSYVWQIGTTTSSFLLPFGNGDLNTRGSGCSKETKMSALHILDANSNVVASLAFVSVDANFEVTIDGSSSVLATDYNTQYTVYLIGWVDDGTRFETAPADSPSFTLYFDSLCYEIQNPATSRSLIVVDAALLQDVTISVLGPANPVTI
jgi:hypothetical protein